MSRVITFSRVFPSYHPRKNEPTYFVEKIARSLFNESVFAYKNVEAIESLGGYDITQLNLRPIEFFEPKHHTIRSGHRWKEGDWFSPRVWSGKPYRSKMIQFAPDIQVKKVFNFDIEPLAGDYVLNGRVLGTRELKIIAGNDGFTETDDFQCWFKLKKSEGFCGQIIAWNESTNY